MEEGDDSCCLPCRTISAGSWRHGLELGEDAGREVGGVVAPCGLKSMSGKLTPPKVQHLSRVAQGWVWGEGEKTRVCLGHLCLVGDYLVFRVDAGTVLGD